MHWGMEVEQVDLACLLVSEVVTNVVLHAAISPGPRNEFMLDAGDEAGWPAGPLPDGPSPLDDWPDLPISADAASGGKEFTLRLRQGVSAIWVEVFDADLRLPRLRSAMETDEGGRGLYLVDQLASRWGSRPTIDGKAVWFEVPLRRSAGRTAVPAGA
jgi:hypothetical protein